MKPEKSLQSYGRWASFAAAALGSATFANATPELGPESSAEVASFIQMDIDSDSRMKGAEVKVTVDDGVAILTGEAYSLAQAQRAAARTIASNGVRSIVNQIRVRPGDSSVLAAKVRSALSQQKLFPANEVAVTVSGTRVTLGGQVGVWDEKDLAREVVSEVPGVDSIRNELVVTDEGIRTDEQIARQLSFMIGDDPLYHGLDLTVTVKDGTASLSGEVGSQGEFNRLVRRSYVTGVVDVNIVGLGIDGSLIMEGLGDKNPSPEEALTNLRHALAKDSRIVADGIETSLQDGVVSLKGEVADIAESEAVEATARAIPGVIRVSNELKVSTGTFATTRRADIKAASAPLVKPPQP